MFNYFSQIEKLYNKGKDKNIQESKPEKTKDDFNSSLEKFINSYINELNNENYFMNMHMENAFGNVGFGTNISERSYDSHHEVKIILPFTFQKDQINVFYDEKTKNVHVEASVDTNGCHQEFMTDYVVTGNVEKLINAVLDEHVLILNFFAHPASEKTNQDKSSYGQRVKLS